MRQLRLFSSAQLSVMCDRTASRNYSPEKDEFRRTHERHRAWGLERRYAEKRRRLRVEAGRLLPLPAAAGPDPATDPPTTAVGVTPPTRGPGDGGALHPRDRSSPPSAASEPRVPAELLEPPVGATPAYPSASPDSSGPGSNAELRTAVHQGHSGRLGGRDESGCAQTGAAPAQNNFTLNPHPISPLPAIGRAEGSCSPSRSEGKARMAVRSCRTSAGPQMGCCSPNYHGGPTAQTQRARSVDIVRADRSRRRSAVGSTAQRAPAEVATGGILWFSATPDTESRAARGPSRQQRSSGAHPAGGAARPALPTAPRSLLRAGAASSRRRRISPAAPKVVGRARPRWPPGKRVGGGTG
jgi:hypothetical protein